MCQLTCISDLRQKNSWINNFLQMRVRILRKVKRKTIFLRNKLIRIFKLRSKTVKLVNFGQADTSFNIRPGDWVKVKSKDKIRKILDDREKYKGCMFIDEMCEHCGKTYKVFKVIDYFFDEAQQKMCKCRDTVILEGVVCSGRQRLYKVSCDRNCFFFWHVAWLEKIEEANEI